MVRAERDPEGSNYQFVIRPNSSLSWHGNKAVFAAVFVVSMGIALMFSLMGAWLVFPFAGLEMLALAAALYYCACRAERLEVVTIRGDDVEIAKGRTQVTEHWTFQRHWAQVKLEIPRHAWYASRLKITCRGRGVEVGSCLNEDERRALAGELKRAMRPGH